MSVLIYKTYSEVWGKIRVLPKMLGFTLDLLWNETYLPHLKNKLGKIIHPSNLAESGSYAWISSISPRCYPAIVKRPTSAKPFPPPSVSQQCRHPTKGWALVDGNSASMLPQTQGFEGTSDQFCVLATPFCELKNKKNDSPKVMKFEVQSNEEQKSLQGMWSWNCTSFPASNPAQQVCPLLVGFLFARKHFHELLRLEPGFIVGGGIGNFFSNFLDFLIILQMKYPPWKLTRHWKISIFNGKYNLKCLVFHCHVSEWVPFLAADELFWCLLPLACCLLMCTYACTTSHVAVTLYSISVTG